MGKVQFHSIRDLLLASATANIRSSFLWLDYFLPVPDGHFSDLELIVASHFAEHLGLMD